MTIYWQIMLPLAASVEREEEEYFAVDTRASHVTAAWAGADSDHWLFPVLDQLPTVDNVYLATGHAMLGITLAPASGQAMAQLMLQGRRPVALEPFTLERLYG